MNELMLINEVKEYIESEREKRKAGAENKYFECLEENKMEWCK